MNYDETVYRTAPATPGLLKKQGEHKNSKKRFFCLCLLNTTLCSFSCKESARRLGDAAARVLVIERVRKNQKLLRCVTARHIKQDTQNKSHKRKHTTFQVKWLEWDCVKKKIMVYPEYTITLFNV